MSLFGGALIEWVPTYEVGRLLGTCLESGKFHDTLASLGTICWLESRETTPHKRRQLTNFEKSKVEMKFTTTYESHARKNTNICSVTKAGRTID